MAEKKKIIKVDVDKCIGCGSCEAIAPDYFRLSKEGISTVIKQYDETEKDQIEQAKDSCPVNAIEIVEE